MATNYRKAKAPPNETQQAILNAIPQLTPDDLEAYSQMASPNSLPAGECWRWTQVFPDLPAECNADQRLPDNFGGVPAYLVLRFTMIEDNDPSDRGFPPERWDTGRTTGTAVSSTVITNPRHQGWTQHQPGDNERPEVDGGFTAVRSQLRLARELGSRYNGYVNVILNSVWSVGIAELHHHAPRYLR